MGVELWSGVSIDRTGGVMLELGGNEFAGGRGGIIAADAGLCVSLQLRESDGHGLPMGLSDAVITTHEGGQRDGFWELRT